MFGNVQEKKDFFLDPVPSNVGEEDIKKALHLYNIVLGSVRIRERAHDRTRFAFLTVDSIQDFEQLQQLSELTVKEQRIKVKVSKDRSKDDEDNQLKAKISVLLRQAIELGVNIQDILSRPSSTSSYGNELSRTSCGTFHAVKTDCEEVRLTCSLKVDPMTNEVEDTCHVERDPLTEAMYDTVRQEDTSRDDILSHYVTPQRVSSNIPQRFADKVVTSTPGDVRSAVEHPGVEEGDLDPATSMLRDLHLERSGRNKRGAEMSHNNLDHRTVSDDSDSFYTPMSSTTHSRAGSQELNPPRTTLASNLNNLSRAPPASFPSNNLSGGSAGFPFNFSPGRVAPPPIPRHEPAAPNTHKSLVLPPRAARKADLPYTFRYVFSDRDVIDDWFERSGDADNQQDLDTPSPMSVEETFDLNQIEAPISPPFDEPERNVNLGRFCMHPMHTEEQDSKDVPQPNLSEPKTTSEDILKDFLELLQVFRVDIEAMSENKQFDDFEGIALQVNHIFYQLKDHRLISQSVIDMESHAILDMLKATEEDLAEIQKMIDEMDEEEEQDLIEELREETLPEKMAEFKEQKADLLSLQICNVIQHGVDINNASNPE